MKNALAKRLALAMVLVSVLNFSTALAIDSPIQPNSGKEDSSTVSPFDYSLYKCSGTLSRTVIDSNITYYYRYQKGINSGVIKGSHLCTTYNSKTGQSNSYCPYGGGIQSVELPIDSDVGELTPNPESLIQNFGEIPDPCNENTMIFPLK